MTTMLSTRSATRRFLPAPATLGQRRLLFVVTILLVAHVVATVLFVLGG